MGKLTFPDALGDYSVATNSTRLPGFRPLLDYETIKCGTGSLRPCTRAEALQSALTIFPFSSAFNTPNYSNMAFQILAYAVENITGTAFPDLVRKQLLEPLNLRNTFLTLPPNTTTNAAITDGWTQDFGGLSPSAGYYLSASDLTTLGTSILSSTLLPPVLTRKWLKPLTHTSSLLTSLGRPWEIIRARVPISTTSKTTRIVDIYTKQGGGATYTSLIALSPAHNLGISILTAGPTSGPDFRAIKSLALETFIPAAEQAARDTAGTNFAGNYTLGANSSLDLGLHPDEPGLYIRKLVSNGVDILALAGQLKNVAAGSKMAAWLYPMGLAGRAFSGTEVAFRATFGAVGVPAAEDCGSWASADQLRYGGYPADLALFGVAGGGAVSSVRFPMLNEISFRKSGGTGEGIFGPFE
ncbi:beta-lactamase/transpeptidase-like protein [Cercophora newfieldiana]|uniref:Beta-lactamase/transpeptidase-like protein n=1 Tax=Cercophora newfieldiana TaxID=92897 RepID=A0AA40CS46_9PEZI|nr:beta-lactamase/transpeptidase-like protein [Cercophora newfieldiana]